MRKVIYVIAAVLATVFSLPGNALADGMMFKRHARNVAVQGIACSYGCVVRRPACPDPYSWSSLYGAYGPYGGRASLTRYTRAGWDP